MSDKLIFLSKQYDAVIGDEFQLFYRGVIRSMNPYKYYIYVNCVKGNPYPRYFSYTPKKGDEGEYTLRISLFDDFMNEIESAETKIIVHACIKPKLKNGKKINILCLGDSLTYNGVWPSIGAYRFESNDEDCTQPKNYGMGDCLNFIGTCTKEIKTDSYNKKIGYEGYGGWQWRHFVLNEAVDTSSGVWVEYKNHPFTENDQHSVWTNKGLKWVMESIEKDKIKFKRGPGNYTCSGSIDDEFIHLDGGEHTNNFKIESYEFEKGNPFYDKEEGRINFKKYCVKNGFDTIDYLYVLLSWNGQYRPFSHDHKHHEEFMIKFFDQFHKDYPNCKVRLIGIQSCSIDGGIASNYGANGPYHDTFGSLSTAFFYDEFLSEFVSRDEYKDYMRYIDMKAQFDVENNMPHMERKVNVRSEKTELIGSNGVHPTMDGYKQIGDCFFRALVRDMNEENK